MFAGHIRDHHKLAALYVIRELRARKALRQQRSIVETACRACERVEARQRALRNQVHSLERGLASQRTSTAEEVQVAIAALEWAIRDLTVTEQELTEQRSVVNQELAILEARQRQWSRTQGRSEQLEGTRVLHQQADDRRRERKAQARTDEVTQGRYNHD